MLPQDANDLRFAKTASLHRLSPHSENRLRRPRGGSSSASTPRNPISRTWRVGSAQWLLFKDIYPVLRLDRVVLSRKTGAGGGPPVLVALGIRPNGKREIIDERPAVAEKAKQEAVEAAKKEWKKIV